VGYLTGTPLTRMKNNFGQFFEKKFEIKYRKPAQSKNLFQFERPHCKATALAWKRFLENVRSQKIRGSSFLHDHNEIHGVFEGIIY
jgi:hypothetical protein